MIQSVSGSLWFVAFAMFLATIACDPSESGHKGTHPSDLGADSGSDEPSNIPGASGHPDNDAGVFPQSCLRGFFLLSVASEQRCVDIDECRIPLLCGAGGKCTNTEGSFECECAGPAWVSWRNLCVCSKGYTRSTDGLCLADDGRGCSDDLDCLNNHCEGGTCCAVTCDRPGECHTRENATCSDGATCEYPLSPDGTTCDDAHACTIDSVCEHGVCNSGKAQRCDDENPCTDDSCEEPLGCRIKNNNTTCDDHNACTQDDHCNAGACGGATLDCSAGDGACRAGLCDPSTGQCRDQTFADGTSCDDANSCTVAEHCAAGSCSSSVNMCDPNAANPCAGNPCGDGRGTCTATAEGGHQCSCGPGYVAAKDTCVCDLSGTFAARSRIDLAWDRFVTAIEPGDETVYSYAIERHSYDSRGNLQLELLACGSSPFDVCGVGIAPTLAAEAYSQYLPNSIWELPSMPTVKAPIQLGSALPGASFETPLISMVRGLSLTDPLGPWPLSYHDVAGMPGFDGSATNGAAWLDQDADGFAGITSYVVPPGGVQAGTAFPEAPRTYGAISPICPRKGGTHTPYAYWPAPAEGLSPVPIRVKRFYTASRIVSAYRGKIASCDKIAGDITGVGEQPVQLEARIGGCIRQNADSETACSTPAIDFMDGAVQSDKAMSSSFILKRWPSDLPVTCSAARSFNYD